MKPATAVAAQRRQLQFLRQSARLEEGRVPIIVRGTGVTLILGLFALIAWASVTTVQEIASAPGEIAPKGLPQIVQHFDGGIVQTIHVEDGRLVNEGDVLLTLDGTGAREELRRAKEQERGLVRNRDIVAELYAMQLTLDSQGHSSRVRVLEAKKVLNDAETALAQQRETIARLAQQVERLEARAPLHGIVKGLKINTIGAVVRPGETLMEIVPLDRALVAETRIRPRDIGHAKIGQRVKVKVSAFDFSRYGAIDGQLEFISATTFSSESGEPYYRGRISLSQDYIGEDPKRRLLPGMTIDASIFTGEKTILAYLFKPIHRAFAQGLSER